MRTFDLIECAEFLKVERTFAMKLAGEGKLPGAKVGKAWVFLEDDLIEYLRAEVRNQMRFRQSTFAIEEEWKRANKVDFAGLKLKSNQRPLPTLVAIAELPPAS